MPRADLAGLGVSADGFSGWEQFRAALRGELVDADSQPRSQLIPSRERRRAPTFVKAAVVVMEQACDMAQLDPASVATVFASGMGDMQTTDYMCRTLASMPGAMSPTRFHNSVHNAAPGYWSIATGSNSPSSALSGYDCSAAVALLEATVQVAEERIPVLVTVQELAPPTPFASVYDGDRPFAAALVLVPEGTAHPPLGTLSVDLVHGASPARDPAADESIAGIRLASSFATDLLELLAAVAAGSARELSLPVSATASLALGYETRGSASAVSD